MFKRPKDPNPLTPCRQGAPAGFSGAPAGLPPWNHLPFLWLLAFWRLEFSSPADDNPSTIIRA
jgi:hypothetical protein